MNLPFAGYKTYITAALMLVVGLAKMAGIDVPGFSVDPGTMITAAMGLVFARLGAKSDAAKAVVFLALALALASPPVSAANLAPPMATKANPFAGYVAGRCGAYAGINTMGVAGTVNGGPPGASIIQGDVGLTVGYGCPIGTVAGSFWFVEGNFDFANINGSSSGLGLSGPAHFEQRFALGSPISTALSVFPGNPFGGLAVPSTPACPTNVTCGPQFPFIFAALYEQDIGGQFGISQNREWLVSPGIGLGLESRWSNGVVADVTAQWKLDSSGLAIGPQSVKLGNAAVVGLTLKY